MDIVDEGAVVVGDGRGVMPALGPAPRSADDVRRFVAERKIEFLFAQFVDMHSKPSAKLVPADRWPCSVTE